MRRRLSAILVACAVVLCTLASASALASSRNGLLDEADTRSG
jgi:hypothetical protein